MRVGVEGMLTVVSDCEDETEVVIVVWDRKGKYFQTWASKYGGDGVAHGKVIAKRIGGTYKVVVC